MTSPIVVLEITDFGNDCGERAWDKNRELDVWHLEHVTYTPAPPGPKRGQIHQSILGYQKGGERIVCLKPTGVGLYCCLCSREWRGRGKQWSGLQSMGEKGGTWSESHVGMGLIVWPKNRMISRRVSSLIDKAQFLLPGHWGWRSLGKTQSTFEGGKGLMFQS